MYQSEFSQRGLFCPPEPGQRFRGGHEFTRLAALWRYTVLGLVAALLWVGLLPAVAASAPSANKFVWSAIENRVSADIQSASLYDTLRQVAASTGWKVYLEPRTVRTVSAKFKDLPPGDALRLLFGDLNYALVPHTNGQLRLFVFHTTRLNATELVEPGDPQGKSAARAKVIPNQLVVRLKPGARIEELARLLGAKVVGRIDSLNAYLLQFDNEAATDAARQQLEASSDVESVDNNFAIERPPSPQAATSDRLPPPPRLQLNPPPDTGRTIVGLIDTAVQPLGNNLDQFLLQHISVAEGSLSEGNSPSHGTAMAETILRGVEQITHGKTAVQILPVDVYGSSATTSTFDVSEGIVTAVNRGANVINLSLGSEGDDSLLRSVIAQVSAKNIPIFAAAGNQPVTTPVYPAAYAGVTAVTAVSNGQLAPYANHGDFVALGVSGASVVHYNGQTYLVQGTSPASASAAGIGAGYLDATGNTRTQMESFMRTNWGVSFSPANKK